MRQGNSFISGNLSFYQDNDNLKTNMSLGQIIAQKMNDLVLTQTSSSVILLPITLL